MKKLLLIILLSCGFLNSQALSDEEMVKLATALKNQKELIAAYEVQIANYEELYFLSDYGEERTLILFYNEFDSCCFPGTLYNKFPFGNSIKSKLSEFEKSNFDVIIDYGQIEHAISDNTLNTITSQIENNSSE